MKTITVLEKAYGEHKRFALRAFRDSLSIDLEGLKVEPKKIHTNVHDWVTVELEGEDEEVAYNLLKRNYGTACSLKELKEGDIRKGKLLQTGKYGYGLYLDIGIKSEDRLDAFIPLHSIRRQLANNEKIPLKQIIYACGLLDNFTLEVKIDEINSKEKKIQASLSAEQLLTFRTWFKDDLERLIISGVTRKHLKKFISETGHAQDILAIERNGLLEQVVVCKQGTNAPGLLAEIGPFLSEAAISLFIPENAKTIFS